jgi:hypothetical protein
VRLLVVLLIFFLEEENLGMADVRVIILLLLLLWANLSMSCCTRQKRPMELLIGPLRTSIISSDQLIVETLPQRDLNGSIYKVVPASGGRLVAARALEECE